MNPSLDAVRDSRPFFFSGLFMLQLNVIDESAAFRWSWITVCACALLCSRVILLIEQHNNGRIMFAFKKKTDKWAFVCFTHTHTHKMVHCQVGGDFIIGICCRWLYLNSIAGEQKNVWFCWLQSRLLRDLLFFLGGYILKSIMMSNRWRFDCKTWLYCSAHDCWCLLRALCCYFGRDWNLTFGRPVRIVQGRGGCYFLFPCFELPQLCNAMTIISLI